MSGASDIIYSAAHEEANIIFGAVVDHSMEGKVKITVIATGFDRLRVSQSPASEAAKEPIELTGYAAVARAQTPEPLIANTSRVIVSRRRGLDLPALPVPARATEAARYRRSHRRSGSVAVRCARVPPEERG